MAQFETQALRDMIIKLGAKITNLEQAQIVLRERVTALQDANQALATRLETVERILPGGYLPLGKISHDEVDPRTDSPVFNPHLSVVRSTVQPPTLT